jgi:hypothetical protein
MGGMSASLFLNVKLLSRIKETHCCHRLGDKVNPGEHTVRPTEQCLHYIDLLFSKIWNARARSYTASRVSTEATLYRCYVRQHVQRCPLSTGRSNFLEGNGQWPMALRKLIPTINNLILLQSNQQLQPRTI